MASSKVTEISGAGEYITLSKPSNGELVISSMLILTQTSKRPEDMTTFRKAYKIDERNQGWDVPGETAAGTASTSIAFRKTNPRYSHLLLHHAQQVTYCIYCLSLGISIEGSVRVVKGYYPLVSGFKDELLWLYKATDKEDYLRYALDKASEFGGITWAMNDFTWDVKFVRLQLIASMVNRAPAGLLYVRQWNNMQYVSNAVFLLTVYSDHLRVSYQRLRCDRGETRPLVFVKSQVDYILGANPMATCYLVGYSSSYPQRMHHRGGSIESYN
ncbi:hypothetical protein V6N13_117838 [Hibiscus sabdariffa]|uniref:Endoglucanase n=1 Tax=Hibiscus sabdariffa TaxID=183260 RepID=A0ABR2Q9L0_9ROSI